MRQSWATLLSQIRRLERAYLGFTPDQLYRVVADVANYKHFLPWCTDSVVHSSAVDAASKAVAMEATLEVGFPPFFKEQYTSHVAMTPTTSIQASLHEKSQNQLLSDLVCTWTFEPNQGAPRSSKVSFELQFSFSSAAHQSVTNLVFGRIAQTMSDAFVSRCEGVYGRPSHPKRLLECKSSTQ